jgi:hypothetical protein
MGHRIPNLAVMIIVASQIGCGKKSSDSSGSSATAASTITLQIASTTLTAGATTVIYVTGGSGSYTNAYASEGTIHAQSANTYAYTAPTSPASSIVSISISDSSGNIGSGAILISGTTATTTTASSCGGTFTATIGGVSATMYVVQGSGNYIGGYLYMASYYYPLIGTCTLSSGTGSLSFTNVANGASYSGTVSLSGTQLSISGTMTSGGSSYAWTATSQTAAATFTTPAYSCQGNYNATIGSNTGSITIVQDGSGNVAGYLYLLGYIYALSGTCNANGGAVSITNHTTGSRYTGTATYSGSKVNMSGSFITSPGATYSWSASQQ